MNDITCASVSPNMAASCRLSGFVTYFCTSNRFSRPFRCRFEKTARDHDLFRFPWPPLLTSVFSMEYGPEEKIIYNRWPFQSPMPTHSPKEDPQLEEGVVGGELEACLI